MASQAQIAANLANSNKSTGPKTSEGKERARMNALRHGLTGQISVLTAEDRAAFDAHCSAIRQALAPVGALEVDLAQSIAEDRWRLKRARAIEGNIFALGHCGDAGNVDTGDLEIDAALGQARTWLSEARNLQLLTLYEQRIHRAVEKNTAELRTLQGERKAAAQQALEEQELLAKVAWLHDEEYVPEPEAAHAPAEIRRIVERGHRLSEARYHEQRGWNPLFEWTPPAYRIPLDPEPAAADAPTVLARSAPQ